MSVEVPESFGGAGGTFFHSVLAVESLSRVDPSVGVLVDVQNTLVINAVMRWGSDEIKRKYLPKLAAEHDRRLLPVGSGLGQRRVRAGDARRPNSGDGFAINGRKLWITNGNEADLFIVFANVNPDAGYRGITAFIVDRGTPGFTVGKKEDKLGIRASSTCELIFEDCVVPKSQILGEVGKGYKVAIETLNEGPHRHRRADARPGAGRARSHDRVHQGAQAVRQADRRLPGRAVPARAHGHRRRSARACSSTTAPACATPACRSSPKRRCARSTRRKSPSASPRWPSTSTAATAS